jgi:eukaryotic-like serine/threonine-protein kinase
LRAVGAQAFGPAVSAHAEFEGSTVASTSPLGLVAQAQDASGEGGAQSDVDDLKKRLVEEFTQAWWRGECVSAEQFLQRYPELHDLSEVVVRVIYEEICLRHEMGEQVLSEEIWRRFPRWRSRLEILLQCHRLLEKPASSPAFPNVGEDLGDCHLLAELGRGALGRVFLARQSGLADRPVVLKVTPCDGQEHLSLARLQHSHIVPLYAAHDYADKNLRVLCMPYLGGASLARVLKALEPVPQHERTGQHLLNALEGETASPVTGSSSSIRQYLARVSYLQAVCWIGACLADALHYAHERGVVHFDIKPGNVLLAEDGQPLLLDFHLARQPLGTGPDAAEWIGGTRGYMSPEQGAAMATLGENGTLANPVDGRSDIYSLGVVLCEALGGNVEALGGAAVAALRQANQQVSVGRPAAHQS